jgi:hypothetical protein
MIAVLVIYISNTAIANKTCAHASMFDAEFAELAMNRAVYSSRCRKSADRFIATTGTVALFWIREGSRRSL